MSRDDVVIAQALGEALGLASRGSTLEGELFDAPLKLKVWIQRGMRNQGTVYNPGTKTSQPVMVADPSADQLKLQAELRFWPILDVRPTLAPSAGFAALQSAGREGFERRFLIRNDPRVHALLGREVQEALDASFIADPGPKITDASIEWGASFGLPWPQVASLVDPIYQVARAWQGIWEAGRTVPVAEGLEDAFAALAGLTLPPGMYLRGCPCGLAGTLTSVRVAARVAATEEGFVTWVGIRFPEALVGGPEVVRESSFGLLSRFGAMLTGRKEIKIGDPEFDERFAIRSSEPTALKAELAQKVRQGMLALDQRVPLRLDANGITGTSAPGNADTVAEIAKRLLELGQQF